MLIDTEIVTKNNGLTAFEAALAWLSTVIGAGIITLPFAFYHIGIPLALLLNILIATLGYSACLLYFRVKDLTCLKSFTEIGYKL